MAPPRYGSESCRGASEKCVCVFIWEKPHAVAATTPSIPVPLRLAARMPRGTGAVPQRREFLEAKKVYFFEKKIIVNTTPQKSLENAKPIDFFLSLN